jgi:hypothetical protein
MAQSLADLTTQLQQKAKQNQNKLTVDQNLVTGNINYTAVIGLLNSSLTLSFTDVAQGIVYNSTSGTLTITGQGSVYQVATQVSIVFAGQDVPGASCMLSSLLQGFQLSMLNTNKLIPQGAVSNGALQLFSFPKVNLLIASPGPEAGALPLYTMSIGGDPGTTVNLIPALELSLKAPGLQFTRNMAGNGTITESLVIGAMIDLSSIAPKISLELPVAYFSEANQWELQVESPKDGKQLNLKNVVQLLAGTNPFSTFPPALMGLGNVMLNVLTVNFDMNNFASPGVNEIYMDVSTGEWEVTSAEATVPFIIKDAGFTLDVKNPFSEYSRSVEAFIYGKFEVGTTTKLKLDTSVVIDITTGNWLFDMKGSLKGIDFPSLFKSLPLLSDQSVPDLPVGFTLTEIDLNELSVSYNSAATSNKLANVKFDVTTVLLFTIDLGPLKLSLSNPYAQFSIDNPFSSANRKLTGAVGGKISFGEGDSAIDFALKAEKPEADKGWIFSGTLAENEVISLGDIVTRFMSVFGVTLPDWVDKNLPEITAFQADITTPPSNQPAGKNSYHLKGAANWDLSKIFDFPVKLNAALDVTYGVPSGGTVPALSGTIMGKTLLNDVLEVGIGYQFQPNNKAIAVSFDGIMGTYNTTTTEISITFTNQTLGSIISHLMQTIDASFELTPPWSFLNDISLSGLGMKFNVKAKTVAITYTHPIDMGFIKINSFTLNKAPNTGVTISIDGSFLGMSTSNPASPLNQPRDIRNMPAAPGKGNAYFNLNMLALGQRVSIQNYQSFKSIEDVIKALSSLQNPPAGKIPVAPNGTIWYNPDSSWLMASKFGILKITDGKSKQPYAIEMDIVFNDPNIYGLLIQLDGDQVKIFKGLKFEILYKKISDSVGMYQIDLTLPESIRNLNFGAVSIVLPSVFMQIYTNGDFLVDIGFPHNLDFSRSFAIYAVIYGIPLMGGGGFYFGKLSSATSTQVPKTTKGEFNPVMVFGLGLQFGLGYTFNKGILAAGFSLTLIGILEGVIAKFHSYGNSSSGARQLGYNGLTHSQQAVGSTSSSDVQDAYYFWIRGTIGIMGRLYGSIDFAIIKASLNVTISATVSTTYESYRRMPITLTLSVSVELTVKIDLWLFSINIHLSFKASFSENLSIGEDHIQDAPWYDGTQKQMLRSNRRRMLMFRSAHASSFNFDNLQNGGKTENLTIYFAPHLTVSGNEAKPQDAKQGQYVAMLYTDTLAQNAKPTLSTSFEKLAQQVFRWVVAAHVANGKVTPEQLDASCISGDQISDIFNYLAQNPVPLSDTDIVTFLGNFFKVDIQSPDNKNAADITGTVFPMFPFLQLSIPAYGNLPKVDHNFWNYVQCKPGYIDYLQTYFNQVMVQPPSADGSDKITAAASMRVGDDTLVGFARIIFADYFQLIARQMMQAALDKHKSFAYTVTGKGSLENILDDINGWHSGGEANEVTAQELAAANATLPLTGNKAVLVSGVQHTVDSTDSISSVAQSYGLTAVAFAERFAVTQGLLQQGASVTYNSTAYTIGNDTIQSVADHFKVTVAALMDPGAGNVSTVQGLLAHGNILPMAGASVAVQSSDTLSTVQARFNALAPVTLTGLVTQNLGNRGLIKADVDIIVGSNKYTTKPGDTLSDILAGFPNSVPQADIINATGATPGLLTALASLFVPVMTYTTAADHTDSLQAIATRFFITTGLLVTVDQNLELENLFYSDGTTPVALNVTDLHVYRIGDLLAQLMAGKTVSQVSGMAARFFLHGLQLPVTADVTLPADSPCTGQRYCALYNMTGQQFPVPAKFTTDPYNITLQVGAAAGPLPLDWLTFNGAAGNSVTVSLDDKVEAVVTAVVGAASPGVIPVVQSLAPLPVYAEAGALYTFRTATGIRYAEAITLPGGAIPAGTVPYIWAFPPSLAQAVSQSRNMPPQCGLLIGSGGTVDADTPKANLYAWSTQVSVTLKKMPAGGDFCYQLIGTDETGAMQLQQLLTFFYLSEGKFDTSFVNGLYLMYNGAGMLNYDGNGNILSFIVNSNLSTDTNPPPGTRKLMSARAQGLSGILNSVHDFIRLLWECSVVRSGGFYLYYNNNGNGLPGEVFSQDETGTISLLITYNASIRGQQPGILHPFMNAVITGDTLDRSKNSIIAESLLQQTTYTTKADESLDDITAKYDILLSDLAELNNTAMLAQNVLVTIPSVYYQMKPDDTFDTVASYFSSGAQTPITAAQLQQQNPGVTPGPTVLLYVGNIVYKVTTGAGTPRSTLQGFIDYYRVSMDALSFANAGTKGIFPQGTALKINDQVVNRTSAQQPGTGGFVLTRQAPPAIPKNPSDAGYPYAYLQNTYNLLRFQVAQNAYFKSSIPGLPAGAGDDNPDLSMERVKNAPTDAQWIYQQSALLARMSLNRNMVKVEGMPSPDDNPYAGVGTVAQFNFDWQDMFGNNTVTPFSDPSLAPNQPMNNLPVPLGYIDELIPFSAWPSAYSYFVVQGDPSSPQIQVGFLFDPSRYTVSSEMGVDQKTAQQNAANDLKAYTSIYYQINQVDSKGNPYIDFLVDCPLLTNNINVLSLSQYKQVIGFVNQAYAYLSAVANASGNVPAPPPETDIVLPFQAAQLNAEIIFEVSLQFIIRRPITQVHDSFREILPVWYAPSLVLPPAFKNLSNLQSLGDFATQFEKTLTQGSNWMLKLATGMPDSSSSSAARSVWAIRWGLAQGQNLWCGIQAQPLFYAPAPLANTLVTYPVVSIAPYATGKGLQEDQSVNRAFSDIDMDTWGRAFLEAVEGFLSPEYSVPAFLTGKLNTSVDYVQKVLDDKKKLALYISQKVTNVMAAPAPDGAQLQNAQERMEQQFLNNLVNAYTIDAAVQFPVTVSSPYPDGEEPNAPSLFGSPVVDGGTGDASDAPYSLSTGRIPLKKAGSYLTFMFTAKNESLQDVMDLNLKYKVTHLEHAITEVKGVDGYKSSLWLNFLIPPTPYTIGDVSVPVVLRAYPTPPSLVMQVANSLPDSSIKTLQDAKSWIYDVVYSSSHARQDEIFGWFDWNLYPDKAYMLRSAKTRDLFEELAQFISIYPQIQQDMVNWLLKVTPDTTTADTVYTNANAALQAFSDCVHRVTVAWQSWIEKTGNVTPPHVKAQHSFQLNIQETNASGNEQVNLRPSSTGISHLNLPLVLIDPDEYRPVPNEPSAVYQYETNDGKSKMSAAKAQGIAERTVSFRGLDILLFQNAMAAVQLVRNRQFKDKDTNPSFIYQTPFVQFANKLVPLLDCGKSFNIASVGGTTPVKRSIEAQLANLFSNLFPRTENAYQVQVKLGCSYSYSLSAGSLLPPVTLPVLLSTPFSFNVPDDYTIPAGGCPSQYDAGSSFVCRLGSAIRSWYGGNLPSQQGGMFVFDVSVFSLLNPEQQLPLLRLSNLQLMLGDIDTLG